MRYVVTLPFVLLTFSANLTAQCTTDRGPDHADWHADYSARRALTDRLESVLRSSMIEPVGTVTIRRDPSTRRITEVETDPFAVPESAYRAFVANILESQNIWEDDDSMRVLTLGEVPTPLWPDSTVECPPSLINRAWIQSLLQQAAVQAGSDAERRRLRGREIRVEFWLRTATNGEVTTVQVKSSSGDYAPWVYEETARIARQLRFSPATINGVPQAVWISQFITVEFR